MKNILLVLFTAFLTNNLFAQDGYHIKLKIKGAQKDSLVQLAYHYSENKLLKDSARVGNNGEIEFKGDEKMDEGVYLLVMPGQNYFEFIVNQDQEFSMTTDTADFVEFMEVKGNEENVYFYEYLKFVGPLGKERYELIEEYKKEGTSEARKEEIKEQAIAINEKIDTYRKKYVTDHAGMLSAKLLTAMEDPAVPPMDSIADEAARRSARYNYYVAHYFDNLDLDDDRMLRTPVFYGKLHKYLTEIIVQTPDSLIKAADFLMASTGDNDKMFRFMLNFITQEYSPKKDKAQIMCLDEIPYHMYKNYFLEDKRVDWVSDSTRKLIEEEVLKTQYNLCGDIAQELLCKDTLGVTHPLSQVKKKYTILYFYSATCGHCKKATPKLQEMYNRVKDELDLEVYAVCIDDDDKENKKFINKHNYEWLNLMPSETDKKYGFRTKYNVFSTPTMYVLNSKKEIIGKKLGVEDLEDFLKKVEENEAKK